MTSCTIPGHTETGNFPAEVALLSVLCQVLSPSTLDVVLEPRQTSEGSVPSRTSRLLPLLDI